MIEREDEAIAGDSREYGVGNAEEVVVKGGGDGSVIGHARLKGESDETEIRWGRGRQRRVGEHPNGMIDSEGGVTSCAISGSEER